MLKGLANNYKLVSIWIIYYDRKKISGVELRTFL